MTVLVGCASAHQPGVQKHTLLLSSGRFRSLGTRRRRIGETRQGSHLHNCQAPDASSFTASRAVRCMRCRMMLLGASFRVGVHEHLFAARESPRAANRCTRPDSSSAQAAADLIAASPAQVPQFTGTLSRTSRFHPQVRTDKKGRTRRGSSYDPFGSAPVYTTSQTERFAHRTSPSVRPCELNVSVQRHLAVT